MINLPPRRTSYGLTQRGRDTLALTLSLLALLTVAAIGLITNGVLL